MSRFDPDPTAPYGKCNDCPVTFVDRDEMRAHLDRSMEESPDRHSHIVSVLNPTRAERIKRAVQSEADDAIDSALTDFVDGLWDLINREGLKVKELTEAVKEIVSDIDWTDAWAEATDGEDDEDEDDDTPKQEHQETSLFDLTEMSS